MQAENLLGAYAPIKQGDLAAEPYVTKSQESYLV